MRILAGLITLSLSLSASAFEGEIRAEATDGGKGKPSVQWTTYYNKAGDVRLDITSKDAKGNARRTSMIMPAKAKHFFLEDHEKKTVMKMANQSRASVGTTAGKSDSKRSKVSVTKLGTEKIAGQLTQHVRITEEDGSASELWISDKYPYDLWAKAFAAQGGQGSQDLHSAEQMGVMKEHGIKPGLVMKTVTKKEGKTTTFQILDIHEGKVASSQFSPNPKYKSEEVPTMPDGVKTPTTPEEAKKLQEEMMIKYGR